MRTGVQNFGLIVLAFLVTLLMQALPLWLVMAAVILGFWKWWILRNGSGQPSRFLLSALGTLMLTLVLLDHAPLFSRESMSAIVCIASLLFILDRPHARQIMLAHGGFYGMLISLLVTSGATLPLLLYFFLTVLIFFSLLLHHLPPSAVLSLWPLGRNILKIAVPVAAILLPIYFFFPDLRSSHSQYGTSGISEILEPGRIATLALSDQTAFRVRFLGEKPEGKNFYWRSTVLEESFGMIWRKKALPDIQAYPPSSSVGTVSYEIIPELRMGIGLPLMEHTIAARGSGSQASQIWWHPDLRIFQSQNEIIEASAIPFDRFVAREKPPAEELKIALSARVQALVDQLKKQSPEQQIQGILERMSSFRYTLRPGTLDDEDPLDDFLFEKRRGFCEHFAAAFASLLQLAGTPARVVIGYQGGVFIGRSDFLLVRDSDAHAWTEVYLDGRWRRFDPSSVAQVETPRDLRQPWLTALPAAWFAYGLRITVVKLRELAQEFEYIWLGVALLLVVTLSFQIWHLQKKRQKRAIWQTEMEHFFLAMEKRGLHRPKHEGMRDFLQRVAERYPDKATSLTELSHLYLDVLYGPPEAAGQAGQLVKHFKKVRRLIQKAASG